MSEQDWYLVERGQQVGPMSRTALVDRLRRPGNGPDTLVWNPEMTEWTPAGATEIASAFASTPPPPPPAAASVPRAGGGGTGGMPSGAVSPRRPSPSDGYAAAVSAPNRWVSFGDAFALFWRNYATFSGRSSRSELWWAILGVVLISFGLSIVDVVVFGTLGTDVSPLATLFSLATFIPGLAVGARRLHDTDRSAWWLLIALVPLIGAIVLLVFYCLPSNEGPNRFGP